MNTILTRTRRPQRLLAGSVVAAAALMATQPASAATATSTLDVSATVTSDCVVSTTALAFGNVDVTSGNDVDGTGELSVSCTSGTGWTATADAGGSSGASLAVRKLTDGTNFLDYALYTDSARTSVWGDGTTAGADGTITGTGTGSAQDNTIYGRVPSGQSSLPAGSYTDTVNVTVTY